MAQSLTPDRVASTLQSYSGTETDSVVNSIGADVAQYLINQGQDSLENEVQGRFVRSINLNWQPGYGGREDLLQVDTFISLWEGEDRHSAFSQIGFQQRGSEEGANFGVGYRGQPVEPLLLGINVFYDYLSKPNVSRYSIGLEARHRDFDLFTNWYQGLEDEVTLSDGQTAYSPDGFDFEFVGRIPQFLPHLQFIARYYRWKAEGLGADDLEGAEYGLRFSPVSLFAVEWRYDKMSGDEQDIGIEASIEYKFDVPLKQQLRPESVLQYEDVWQRRFERVWRQYEQRVLYKGGAPSDQLRITEISGGVRLEILVPEEAEEVMLSWSLEQPNPITGTARVQKTNLTLSGIFHSYDITIPNFDANRAYLLPHSS